jgi:hypothetical protein
MRQPVRHAVLLTLLTITSTACATKETGTPTTPSTSASSAPHVTKPLNGDAYFAKPCAVLTPAQMRTLELPNPGKQDTDSDQAKLTGPGCQWDDDSTLSTLGFDFLPHEKGGLDWTYRQGKYVWSYFEPTEVDGYPAVFNSLGDHRAEGSCNITVGIADSQAFQMEEIGERSGPKSCDRVKQAASLVISTIKSGG